MTRNSSAGNAVEWQALGDALAIASGCAFGVIGLLWVAMGQDGPLVFHGLLLALGAAIGVGYVVTHLHETVDATAFFDGPIRFATLAAVVWGIAGFVVGDVLAWQLAIPALNLDLPWTSFGRLRPLHTSAVIFAFGGNVLLATEVVPVVRTKIPLR